MHGGRLRSVQQDRGEQRYCHVEKRTLMIPYRPRSNCQIDMLAIQAMPNKNKRTQHAKSLIKAQHAQLLRKWLTTLQRYLSTLINTSMLLDHQSSSTTSPEPSPPASYHLPSRASNEVVAASTSVRNLASTRSAAVDDNTVSTRGTCSH